MKWLNGKGQLGVGASPHSQGYSTISPLLVVGVFVFILPFLLEVVNMTGFGWLRVVGMVFIVLGILHSILQVISG